MNENGHKNNPRIKKNKNPERSGVSVFKHIFFILGSLAVAYCTYLCCMSQSVSFVNYGNIEIMKYIDLEIFTLISVSYFE